GGGYLPDLELELVAELWVVDQVGAGVFSSLAQAKLAVAVESAELFDHVVLGAEVDDVALAADAHLAAGEQHVELGLTERRRDLVLDHAGAYTVTDDVRALLQRLDAPDIDTDRPVEPEGAAPGRNLGAGEGDAPLL